MHGRSRGPNEINFSRVGVWPVRVWSHDEGSGVSQNGSRHYLRSDDPFPECNTDICR